MASLLNFSRHAPCWPRLLLLPTLALCVLVALTWRAQLQQRAQVDQLESQVSLLQANHARTLAPRTAARADNTPLPLLLTLETAWRDDVALLRLEIDTEAARTRLTLRTRSQRALQDFVTRLRQTGVEARLLSQESADGALAGAQTATLEVGG